MKKDEKRNNFIIYLLLVVFFITGAGYGLGEECQVFSSYSNTEKSRFFVPTITTTAEIHTFQVRERSSVTMRYNNLKGNQAEYNLRGSLQLLCILAILSMFFLIIQKKYVFYARLYVQERFCIIAFIQNADGRKRIS